MIIELSALYRTCFAESPWFEVFGSGEVEEDLLSALQKRDGVIVLAEKDGKIIGASVGYAFIHRTDMSDLIENSDRVYYYAELFVQNQYRGLGVANMLIAEREKVARQRGYLAAMVRTSVVQQIIQDIYSGRGFRVIARQNVMSDKVIDGQAVRVPDERVIMHGAL